METRLDLDPTLARVCQALNDIGIETRVVDAFTDGAKSFLECIRIVNGALHLTPRCPVSNLLHEAGHLCIIPSRYRALANGDLSVLMRHMLADLEQYEDEGPDSPIYRAVIQTGDTEATAWAWAFGKYVGVPEEDIILDEQYPDEDGNPTGAEIRVCLAGKAYGGINGLAFAGFCSTNRFGRLPVYPELAFWTQEL